MSFIPHLDTTEHNVNTKKYFDLVANDYDSFYNNTLSITENKLVKQLICTEIQPSENDLIIDLGCGTGFFNDLFPKYKNVFGVDISSEMLSIAKQKHPDGLFFCRDMVNTNFPTDYADRVVSLFGSASYVMETQDVFNEIHRILRPEGWFFIMLYNKYSISNMFHGFPSIREYRIRYSNGYNYNCLAKFVSPDDIKEATEDLFECVRIVRMSANNITRMMPHHLIITGVKI